MDFMVVFGLVNFFFAVVIGLYFLNLLRAQQTSRSAIERESRKEMEKLRKMKQISLTEPLAEKTRPAALDDIIGQEEGLKALRAALCGPNPQHVIIYGPPGVGKTAAARVVLEEAKRNPLAPFKHDAQFVEVDATTARFDDRGIADPLMGSVQDRKSTRLNSSHVRTSYADFCLKKKNTNTLPDLPAPPTNVLFAPTATPKRLFTLMLARTRTYSNTRAAQRHPPSVHLPRTLPSL